MFLEPSSMFHPFNGVVEVLSGKMALGEDHAIYTMSCEILEASKPP